MKKPMLLAIISTLLLVTIFNFDDAVARRQKPWPDINLSTLPSVVGAANSWVFEINQRSPAYLSDLDKMYVSLAYGWGRGKNNLLDRDKSATQYGYNFFDARLEQKLYDFKFNIYSNLGKTTYGSLWVTYGKRQKDSDAESIVESTPSRMEVKTAFAWQVAEKITLAASGAINNWPSSLVFVFQPKDYANYDQKDLPADVGENLSAEVDLMYRPDPSLDVIIGGIFSSSYTKFNPPSQDPFTSDGTPLTSIDTAEVKEYIYSGAPRVMIKKTYPSGAYIRGGAAYYFNLFDYQYLGARQYNEPSLDMPSYRPQEFESFIPRWRVFADGSRMLGPNSAVHLAAEYARYPNALATDDTEWAPLRQSLVKLENLNSALISLEFNSKLTRILHGMAGVDLRFVDTGDTDPEFDDRSIYATLRLGTTTRFYRNLWWSIRVPGIRLYTSEALGSSILFQNQWYIETEILFLGL